MTTSFVPRIRINKAETAAVLGAVCLFIVYMLWTKNGDLSDDGGDNAYYLFIARFLAPYIHSSPVTTYFATHSQYPPLYPLTLMLTGGASNLYLAHAVTTVCLLFGFIAMYIYGRTLALPRWVAYCATLLFAVFPGTYFQALSLHSENLYILLSLLCLITYQQGIRSGNSRWFWYAAVLAGATALTRTVGISLVVPFVLCVFIKRVRFAWVISCLAFAPPLLWKLFTFQHGADYLDSLSSVYGNSPLFHLVVQLKTEGPALAAGWQHNFAMGTVRYYMVAIFGILCLFAAVARAVRCHLDGLYLLTYLLIILVWPFPSEASRFIFAITPLLIINGIVLLQNLPWRPQVPIAVLLVALAVTLLPDFVVNARLFLSSVPQELQAYKQTPMYYRTSVTDKNRALTYLRGLREGMRSIHSEVSANDCVLTAKPSILGYYADVIAKIAPYEYLNDQQFLTHVRRSGCHYFFGLPFSTPSYSEVYYPLKRLNRYRIFTQVIKVRYGDKVAPVGVFGRFSLD